MRPKRASAASTACSAAASSATSSASGSTSGRLPKAASSALRRRPVATTLSPLASAAFTISAPIPRAAPVTNQILLMGVLPMSGLLRRGGDIAATDVSLRCARMPPRPIRTIDRSAWLIARSSSFAIFRFHRSVAGAIRSWGQNPILQRCRRCSMSDAQLEFARLIERSTPADGIHPTVLPRVSLIRASQASEPIHVLHEPRHLHHRAGPQAGDVGRQCLRL